MEVNLSEKTIKETHKAIDTLLKNLPVNQKNKKRAFELLELLETWEIFKDACEEKSKTFKTFKDLKFTDKFDSDMPKKYDGKHAELKFDNGYGISVITGFGAYASQDAPFEIAVLKGDALCYDTPITGDVIGYNTKRDVNRIMKEIQSLPKVK